MVVTNWNCLKCGVTNPKTFFKCQTCQEPKPIFWECQPCKTKNPTANLKCSGCKRKRPAIFANAVNVKGLSNVKFNFEAAHSSVDLNSAPQSSALPAPPSSGPTSICSSIGTAQMSTISQITPGATSTVSALSQHVSSYDIFLKLSKPSRTIKQFNYVDSEEKYAQVLANCNKTLTPHSDTSFPIGLKALYFNPKLVKPEKLLKAFWLRPKDMRPADADPKVQSLEWSVVREPIASDITQGLLGNCWLLSALAVLVEKPFLLERVLATKDLNSQGAYRVRLYRDGKLTSVIIDDQFPCNKKRLLVYSCAKRKQLFMPIIEKAMAKMYGCYESLVSGQTTEGLAALTGFPCRSIRTQAVMATQQSTNRFGGSREEETMLDPDFIWTLLLSYQSAGFLMGAGCGCNLDSPIPAEEYLDKGLLMQHAYSIISVATIGEDTRLVQLRNPWGRQVWNGDWSDESAHWTPEMKEQLEPNKSSQGIFWISFTDFQRYFEKVDICKLRDSWHEYRYEGYLPGSVADSRYMAVFEVHVEESGTELEFTLHQESRRSLNLYKTPLMPICAAVFQMKDLQRNIAGDLVDYSGYKIREFVGCDVMVDKGVYLVATYAFNHWNSSPTETKTGQPLRPRFVMSLHSSRFVTVNCVCPSATIIGDTLIELTTAKGRKKKHDDNVVSYYLLENWSGLLVAVENRHADNYLEVIFDASESTNLHTTRGSLSTQDTIPPMSRQLVNILSHFDPSTPYYLSYQMSYRVSAQSASNHQPELGQLSLLHSPRPFKQIRE